MITPEQLAQWEALCEAATERYAEFTDELQDSHDLGDQFQVGYYVHHTKVGEMLTALPLLLAERRRLVARVAELEGCISGVNIELGGVLHVRLPERARAARERIAKIIGSGELRRVK